MRAKQIRATEEKAPAGILQAKMTWFSRRARAKKSPRGTKARRDIQSVTDRADAAEADRILSDPNEKFVDYMSVRKKLGLA